MYVCMYYLPDDCKKRFFQSQGIMQAADHLQTAKTQKSRKRCASYSNTYTSSSAEI